MADQDELTPIEVAQAIASLRQQARAFTQVSAAIEMYQTVQDQCVELDAKKVALNAKLASIQEQIKKSQEDHLKAIRRNEQIREEKLAEQTQLFEQEKILLNQRLAQLKDDIQQATNELVGIQKRIQDAQKETEEHLNAFDELVTERKNQVNKEMTELEAPLNKARDEYEEITTALEKLRKSMGIVAQAPLSVIA